MEIILFFLKGFEKVNICFLDEITKNFFLLIEKKMLKFDFKIKNKNFDYELDYEIEISCFLNTKLFSTTNLIKKKNIFKEEIFYLLKKLKKIKNKDKEKKNENINLDNNEILKFIEDNEQHKNIIDYSPKSLSVKLYDFQIYGLYWMVNKENPGNCVDFNGDGNFGNEIVVDNSKICKNKNFAIKLILKMNKNFEKINKKKDFENEIVVDNSKIYKNRNFENKILKINKKRDFENEMVIENSKYIHNNSKINKKSDLQKNNTKINKNFEKIKKVLNPMWKKIPLDLCLYKRIPKNSLLNLILLLKKINPKNFTKKNVIYFYYNEFTGQISLLPIYLDLNDQLKGGILADEMGLGKTTTLLSLLYFSKENKYHKKKIISNFYKKDINKKKNSLPLANNLIIVPAMLIDHWKTEIIKISKVPLKIKIYKKYKKEINKKKISSYDIILVSYELVNREYNSSKPKTKKFLYNHNWLRIILDEANRIKNKKTQLAKSIYNLKSIYKWCLTGTPIENSINDLFSLLCFLGYKPWSNIFFWEKYVLNPLYKFKCKKAFKLLNYITKSVILRRSKNNYKEILGLKDIEFFNVFVELDEMEKKGYEKKKKDSIIELDLEFKKKNVLHIYEVILRLRQLVDHEELPALSHKPVNLNLILENINDFLLKKLDDKIKKNEKFDVNKKIDFRNSDYVLWKIKENENEFKVCFLCKEDYDEVIITFCLHKFCKICIYKFLISESKCPICKEYLKKNDIFIFPKLKIIDPKKEIKISSKMKKIYSIITSTKKTDKILIFSHFVPMLKILSNFFTSKKIQNLVLEGSLNEKKRQDMIKKFKRNKDIQIFLISIKAGGVGLNLENANIVILVEPWWNPAVGNQAIDRINRIGQKKKMKVFRLCVKNSIEEKICERRDKKDMLFGMTINSCNYKRGGRFDYGVMKDLKYILDF